MPDEGCVPPRGGEEAAVGPGRAGAQSRGAAESGWLAGSISGETADRGGSQTHPAAEGTREKYPATAATVPRSECYSHYKRNGDTAQYTEVSEVWLHDSEKNHNCYFAFVRLFDTPIKPLCSELACWVQIIGLQTQLCI